MKKSDYSRRRFIATVSASSVAAMASGAIPFIGKTQNVTGKLAILGGEPVRKNKSWPEWPYMDEKMVDAIVKTTRSRIWCRIQSPNGTVPTFEKEFAKLMEPVSVFAPDQGPRH